LATSSSGGGFYSDSDCHNTITGNSLTIGVGGSSASFFYKDSTPSPVGGYWTITASENPSAGWIDGSQQILIRAGSFGSFEISGTPSSITAGQSFTSPANDVTVTVKDIFGNVKNDWTGQIWFYSSDSQAVFIYSDQNKYTFTSGTGLDNGIHTFAGGGFTMKTKGNQSLVVHNSEGSQYDAVANVSVAVGATDHFGLSNYPRTAGGKFAMSSFSWDTPGYSSAPYTPKVTVYDAYGNIKDNFASPVWFGLYKSTDTPPSTTADYIFDYDSTNKYTFTSGDGMDNGEHSFAGSGFNVTTAGTDLKLRVATSDNGGKLTDFVITVKPQAIDHFGVSASPNLSRNGTGGEKAVDATLTESVNVTAYDGFGNVKTDYAYDDSSKSGMIYFYSSDTHATVPYAKTSASDSSKCLRFPSDEGSPGSHTFTPENTPTNYFKFATGGPQTLSVSECIDPTSTYATNIATNRYDPRLEGTNPLKTAASTGSLPDSQASPNKIFVANHVPGSTHTATAHSDDANNLIEAAPGHQQATISWYNPFDLPSDQALDPQVYIYRCQTDCDNSANFSKIITNPAKVTSTASTWGSYTDTGLTNGQTYYYKLSYAYLKEGSTYLETDKSITVSTTPADIAPREVSATQLDVSDSQNPGKVRIDYKLRWNSTVSIAFFNPATNQWTNATSPAQSGDVGSGMAGSEDLVSHVAYLNPTVDFAGHYLTDSFKVRLKVVVNGMNAYSDSETFDLDSTPPTSASLLVDASGKTASLTIGATDQSMPLAMMVANTPDFAGHSWQNYSTSLTGWNIDGASTVYVKLRDNFNNTTTLSQGILTALQNVQIKDASNSTTSDYRLAVIWSQAQMSNLEKYNILRATDGENFSTLGSSNQNGYLDMNLDPDTTYSYKVIAQDNLGNLSMASQVVSSSPGTAPDVTAPPQVELFGWKQDVGVRATVTWHTDQLSDSFVAYSTEKIVDGVSLKTVSGNDNKVKVVGLPDLQNNHEVALYNLDPSTKYYFKVLSKNEIQITGYSQVFDFTTPDRVLLLISGTTFTDITNSSAIASWTTSKLSTTLVEYGKSTNYESNIEDKSLNTEHKFKLDNLTAGSYHLRIKATDVDGNVTISDDYVFAVPPSPEISGVSISEVSNNSAKLSWRTNIDCNSNVDFGTSTNYSGSQGNAIMTTTHIVTLIGLESKTTYQISPRSIDQFGNVARGQNLSFTTTADTEAPKILNQKSEISSTGSGDTIKFQLIVSWETSEPATSKVEYAVGMGDTYDSSSKEDLSLNVSHTVIVSELKANSLYHFRIKSADASNNVAYSDDYTVTTPPKEKNILTIILNAITGPIGDIYSGVLERLKR
jgi:hypothetical protein